MLKVFLISSGVLPAKKNYMKSLADGTEMLDESRSLEDHEGSHLLLLHDKRSHP